MQTEDGKIVEATYTELFKNFKDKEFDKLYTFAEYVTSVRSTGCVIKEDTNEEN